MTTFLKWTVRLILAAIVLVGSLVGGLDLLSAGYDTTAILFSCVGGLATMWLAGLMEFAQWVGKSDD